MLDKIKKIICLQGKHDSGKTKTLKKVCKIILEKYKTNKMSDCKTLFEDCYKYDFVKVINNVKGKKIGINTKGDEWHWLERWNKELAEQGCDIIICACRSRGKTVEQVKKMKRKGYLVEFVVKERESVEAIFPQANLESANELLKKAGL